MRLKEKNFMMISLLVIFSLTLVSLNAAWLDDYPYEVTQSDGTVLSMLLSGDEFHNWVHDERGYTVVLDKTIGDWCWATVQNDELVSTGYPIHLHDPAMRSIQPYANISREKYLQLRAPFDEKFTNIPSENLTKGTINQIVIFIRFQDDHEFGEGAGENMAQLSKRISNMFNDLRENNSGQEVNSKRQYFRDVSFWHPTNIGELPVGLDLITHFIPNIDNGVIQSYQAPLPRSYYVENSSTAVRLKLLSDAVLHFRSQINALANHVNFDANRDGMIDNFVFIIKGNMINGNMTFHPHMSKFSVTVSNLANILLRGDIYNLIPEMLLLNSYSGDVGILAHEFGHTLGAPDLADHTVPKIKPIQYWCLMSNQRNPPQSISAHIKERYFEWIEIPYITTSGTYTLYPLGTHKEGSALKIPSPYCIDEYFIVEYRKKEGIDRQIYDPGLLVYRVNQNITGNTEGEPYELYLYRPEATMHLLGNIENAFFSANSGRTFINDEIGSDPRAVLSNGEPGGLNIHSIGPTGETISFYYEAPEWTAPDYEAISISGPEVIIINEPATYTIRVKANIVIDTNSPGEVYLNRGKDNLVSWTNLPYMKQGDIVDISLEWTPSSYGSINLYGQVNVDNDMIGSNDTTKNSINVKVVVPEKDLYVTNDRSLVNNTTHFDTIGGAINASQNGGTITILAGSYKGAHNNKLTIPNDLSVTIRGNHRSIIDCEDTDGFTLNGVDEQVVLEGFKIINSSTAITLNDSNPVIRNLSIENSKTGILINNSIDKDVVIDGCRFINNKNSVTGNNTPTHDIGVAIHAKTPRLKITNSVFRGNEALSYGAGSNQRGTGGAALYFEGGHLHLENNIFEDNIGSGFGGNIHITRNTNIPNPNIFIGGNTFRNNVNRNIGNRPGVSANITIQESNIFLRTIISNNIFITNGNTPSVLFETANITPNYRANIRYVNNTAVSGNVRQELTFNFNPSGRIPKVEIINSLIRSSIQVIPRDMILPDEHFIISHSFLLDKPNVNYAKMEKVTYFEFDDIRRLVDLNTLVPVWNTWTKSPLINAGHYDTIGIGVPWYRSIHNQDPDGTRKDIGAVPAASHGAIAHMVTPSYKFGSNEGGALIDPTNPTHRGRNHFAWVCFPYLDRTYRGYFFVNGKQYTVHDLIYNLEHYDDNNLFSKGGLITWNYNEDSGTIGMLNYTDNPVHDLQSHYGYKIDSYVVYSNNTNHNSTVVVTPATYIKTSGHLIHPNTRMTLRAAPPGGVTETWVGYFLPEPLTPEEALPGIIDYLTEIKTRNWTISRDSIHHDWTRASATQKFVFGEAVSLKYVGNVDRNFIWNHDSSGGGNVGVKPESDNLNKTYEEVSKFWFRERSDYIPIYVTLPEGIVGENGGEIGLFINGECYGAKVIDGEIVQINAYILDDDIDFETAEIEFQIHEYNTRSADRRFSDYLVKDHSVDRYHSQRLDLSQNRSFYQISLSPEQTTEEVTRYASTLYGNYPNPFNPTTTINFRIGNLESREDESHVNIDIFNIKGQKVRTLVNSVYPMGEHCVIWNGRDDHGANVSSGIYLYRMKTDGFTQTNKMVLMK